MNEELTPKIESTLMSDEYLKLLFARLSEPFVPKWRVQSTTKDSKWDIVVPYVDARQVQQRLDDVVLPQNWQNTIELESGTASISILINGEWIGKSDIGTDSAVEKEKGKASDAFKRAAVLWGMGRDIYSIGSKMLSHNVEKKRPMTAKGDILWTPDQLTIYMNGLNTSLGLLSQFWSENKELHADEKFKALVVALKEYVK